MTELFLVVIIIIGLHVAGHFVEKRRIEKEKQRLFEELANSIITDFYYQEMKKTESKLWHKQSFPGDSGFTDLGEITFSDFLEQMERLTKTERKEQGP